MRRHRGHALRRRYGHAKTFGKVPVGALFQLKDDPDNAMLLNAIAGYDAGDPGSMATPAEDYTRDLNRGLKGWRIPQRCAQVNLAVAA